MNVLLLVPEKSKLHTVGSVINRVFHRTGGSLKLLFVANSDLKRTKGERALARAQALFPTIPVTTRLVVGGINALVAELERGEYELLVIGTKQAGGLRGQKPAVLARTAVQRCHITTLLARKSPKSIEHILICTSGTQPALPVVERGASLARDFEVPATVLHVASSVPSMYTGLEELDETLPKLLDTQTPVSQHLHRVEDILAENQIQSELKLRHGVVVDEIFNQARESNSGLIVIGAPQTFVPLQSFFLTNLAWQVVDQANRSVLVVAVQSDEIDPS